MLSGQEVKRVNEKKMTTKDVDTIIFWRKSLDVTILFLCTLPYAASALNAIFLMFRAHGINIVKI